MKVTTDLLKDLRRVTQMVGLVVIFMTVGTLALIYGLATEKPPRDTQATIPIEPQPKVVASEASPSDSDRLASQVVDGIDVATGLRDGVGLSLVKANCLACHSAKLIAQNRFSRDIWHEKIVWMQQTQGLWDLGENEPAILDYLAEYYAPEAPAPGNQDQPYRRTPLSSIDWYELP